MVGALCRAEVAPSSGRCNYVTRVCDRRSIILLLLLSGKRWMLWVKVQTSLASARHIGLRVNAALPVSGRISKNTNDCCDEWRLLDILIKLHVIILCVHMVFGRGIYHLTLRLPSHERCRGAAHSRALLLGGLHQFLSLLLCL